MKFDCLSRSAFFATLSVALAALAGCAATTDGAGDGEGAVDDLTARQVHDFAWFSAQTKLILASEANTVLGNASQLTDRTDFAGRPLYSFPLATHRVFLRNEVLNKPGIALGYVAKIKLTEFVDGTIDRSWQNGWPSGAVNLSANVYIDGRGYAGAQKYQGGTVHVSVRGTNLDRLEMTVKGPLMATEATVYPLANGYQFSDDLGFRFLAGGKIEIIRYHTEVGRPGTMDSRGFKFGWNDFVPSSQFQPAAATLR